MSENQSYVRKVIAGRYWLLGRNEPIYNQVVKVMEFAMAHHNGKRNGGQPEFIHQIEIFHHLRSLHAYFGEHAPLIYALAFLHDVIEDGQKQSDGSKKYVSFDDIRNLLADTPEFAEVVCVKLRKLSKEILGQKNPEYSLDVIFQDFITAIVKLADRCNNISTMMGVFKRARAIRYVDETVTQFLPNAKLARRTFPEYECVFENMKLFMNAQLQLIEMMMPNYRLDEIPMPATPKQEETKAAAVNADDLKVKAILAHGPDGAIGFTNGDLLLSCSADMKEFKQRTMGGVVVVGRKTFDSFAKLDDGTIKDNPLPGRYVIVLTNSFVGKGEGWTTFNTSEVPFDKVVQHCKEIACKAMNGPYGDALSQTDTIWFAGGAQIYQQLLKGNLVDEWVVTAFYDKFGSTVLQDYIEENKDSLVCIEGMGRFSMYGFLREKYPDAWYNPAWSEIAITKASFTQEVGNIEIRYQTTFVTKKG